MKGMSASQKKQERQYQVDNALSTLKRAAEIRNDPSLMRDVKKAATDLAKSVGSPTATKKRK